MRHVDFSPLYRSTVGFDRLFTMLDSLGQPEQAQSYPPYNIERTGENSGIFGKIHHFGKRLFRKDSLGSGLFLKQGDTCPDKRLTRLL